jgi:hypothetical protein
MKSKTHLDQVLADLRLEHRAIKSPPSLEAHLTQLAKWTPHRDTRIRVWAWGLIVATIVVIAAAAFLWRATSQSPQQQAHLTNPRSTQSTPPLVSNSSPHRTVQSRPRVREVTAAHTPTSKHPKQDNREADTFLTLPVSEGLPVPFETSLVRMHIQKAELRQYGLDVPATAGSETILAEFVVGEDGLPRAIRLIR